MNEIATLNDAVRKSLVNLEVKNSLALINCRFEIVMTANLQNTIENKVGLPAIPDDYTTISIAGA